MGNIIPNVGIRFLLVKLVTYDSIADAKLLNEVRLDTRTAASLFSASLAPQPKSGASTD